MQHFQSCAGHLPQCLAQTCLASDVASEVTVWQHECDPPMALPPEQSAGMSAGRMEIRVHGRQADARNGGTKNETRQVLRF